MTQEQLLLQTQAQMNQALSIAKIYIDRGDAAGKAYTDAKLAEVLQTTDLNAKLALLQQINEILDGDEASAGFQAWQNSVNSLADLAARVTATEVDVDALQTGLTATQAALAAAQQTLDARITSEVATLNTTINAKDTATNTRIDGLETSIATDKIAQVEKDATQSAAIAAEKARVDVVIGALADEATARSDADAALNTRVTANESAISDLQALQGEYVTRTQYVEGMTKMVAAAISVFGINPDGTAATGTSGSV